MMPDSPLLRRWRELKADLFKLYGDVADEVPALKRGRVWCHTCGREATIDAAAACEVGWPVCCGETMSVDSPAERAARRGFTLVELLVVVAVVAVLLGVLLPVLAGARNTGRDAACKSHLRQIALAFVMYRADHKGALPNGWPDLEFGPLVCPADPERSVSSYALAVDFFDVRGVLWSARMDTYPPSSVSVAIDALPFHGWCNGAMLDGSARRMP